MIKRYLKKIFSPKWYRKYSDTTKGIVFGVILGIILTSFGTYLQFSLQKKYYKFQEDRKMFQEISRSLYDRYHRSNTIIDVSGEADFEKRWDSYIENVMYPWNANISAQNNFIRRKLDKDSYDDFRFLQKELASLHGKLRRLKKLNEEEVQLKIKEKGRSNNKQLLEKKMLKRKKLEKECLQDFDNMNIRFNRVVSIS